MEIQQLIEAIDKIDDPMLVHITKETYKLVQEPGNNRLIALNDFRNVFINKEDAIVSLFDADIFGWSIKAVDWCNSSCHDGFPLVQLEVTLFKTTC